MERHGLQFGMCLSPPSSDDFVSQWSILWKHAEGCRPLCVVMSPTHSRLLEIAVEIAKAQLRNGRDFVCITPVHRVTPELFEEHTQRSSMVARCGQVRRGGAFGGSRVAVCDDHATTRDEDATEVRRRRCSRAANSGSASACPYAASHCDKPTPNQ